MRPAKGEEACPFGGVSASEASVCRSCGLDCAVAGQRLRLHRRQQVLPDQVQLALHVAGLGGDGHHGVLLRHDDHELAESAVAAEGVMPAAPELVAVALQPVVLVVGPARLGGQRAAGS